jgi:tetratricopeptide (TPR) repeat protein
MLCRFPALLVAASVLCAGTGRTATLAEAEAFYRARHYPEARAAFEKVAAAEPGNAAAAYYLGQLAIMRDDPEEAAKWLEQATALSPASATYSCALGDAYGLLAQKAGLFSKLSLAGKSRAAYERAVALDPEDIDVRYSLFTFCRQAPAIAGGGLDKARIQALEIQKRDRLRGSLALVELSSAERKYDESFKLLDDVLRSHPGALGACFQFGRTAAMSGQRLDEGAEALHTYLAAPQDEDLPPQWAAHWRLGQILEKKGDLPGARSEYQAGLALNPTQPQLVDSIRRVAQSAAAQ